MTDALINSVATTSGAHRDMVRDSAMVRTLVGGTIAMREAGETYLPRWPSEDSASYKARMNSTVLFNATGKTVLDMAGKVFAKPVILEKDVPKEIAAFAENIDLTGRHINVFARDVFADAMQPGIGYIYVEAPPAITREDGTPGTRADYEAAKWRPYLTFIPMEQLIGWKSTNVDGAEQLTQIRIREYETVEDGPYLEKDIEQIRVITLVPATADASAYCTWETFRQPSGPAGVQNQNIWTAHENGTISLPAIPLAPVYLNRSGFMTGKPPLSDLAHLNVAHWQSSSDQRNILHVARVPILFGAGFDEKESMEVGSNSMFRSNSVEATLTYVEHTGAAIGAGQTDLDKLEAQMQTMGLQLLVPAPGQTATGEIRDNAKENSPLAAMARGLQDALEQALGFMAKFLDVAADGDKAGGSVVVNTDFGLSGGTGDLQYLTQAVVAGKLDDQTYIEELKRRGTLSDSVDVKVVLDRLATAAPELDGAPLPLDPAAAAA